MALAVETPIRIDLTFRDNDDATFGFHWLKSDKVTPIPIDSAEAAFGFDPPRTEFDPATGEPLPDPPPVVHSITSMTPDDPDGWFDPTNLATGYLLVNVPHGVWAAYTGRAGVVDVVAVGEGSQRCLGRGRFVVESGVA